MRQKYPMNEPHAVDFNALQLSLVNMDVCQIKKNVWVYLKYGL